MSQKIRQGNDIGITWSLYDGNNDPYDLRGKDITIELICGYGRVRIRDYQVQGEYHHNEFNI